MTLRTTASALALLLAGTFAASAQNMVGGPYDPSPAPLRAATNDYGDADLVIELGVEGFLSPNYEGSDDYKVTPVPIISLEYLNLPGLGSFGGKDGLGFSVGPSFGFTSERNSSDVNGLDFIDDVDDTYEGGVKASYTWQNAEVYGAVRYAFGGADGFVGEVGGNLIAQPAERLVLKAGPLATFASSGYMKAYFGINSSEAAESNGRVGTFDPDGGFKSVGVGASARYEIFTDYFLSAEGSYQRLVGDAEESPITRLTGDKDQFTFGVGISHRFSFDLF